MENLLTKTLFFLGVSGGGGIFIWLAIGAYVTSKWLAKVENILEDGPTIFNSNIVFRLQGVLHYGSILLWSFHAKRYGMLEKRRQVPKHIQKWYIFAYCWFMTSALLLFSGVVLFYIYIE